MWDCCADDEIELWNKLLFPGRQFSSTHCKGNKEFYEESKIQVIKWPAKSPDINIVEDVWKIISDRVYDGPQFQNKSDLRAAIADAILHINKQDRGRIIELYKTIRSRLCTILEKKGCLFNK